MSIRTTMTLTIHLAAAAVSGWLLLAVDSHSHSVSDTLYRAAVPIGLIWLAAVGAAPLLGRTMARP